MPPREKAEPIADSSEKDEKEYLTPDGLLKITSGFKQYPTDRDLPHPNPILWLEGKRKDDDIGNLWRIHDKLYDLTEFASKHPGGKFWIEISRGTDITEAFESSHLSPAVGKLLPKYYVKDAVKPRVSPFTFKEDGFYMTLKRKVWALMKNEDRRPTLKMYLIQDGTLALFLFFCFLGALFKSAWLIFISSFFLAFTGASAHNFFHQKDNWRMYIFDLMMSSSREWRISHALSHHLFPNTIYDYEVTALEPHLHVLARAEKHVLLKRAPYIPATIMMVVGFYMDTLRRYILIVQQKIPFHWSFTIIWTELLLMSIVAMSFLDALWMWVMLHFCSAYIFLQIGLTAAHHHPDIFREGDAHINNKDFGFCQVIATRDRGVVMTNLFLTSISFGNHTLHHLFPTVDHSLLPKLVPLLLETCEEFGVKFVLKTPWEMLKGFYVTLGNVVPNPKKPDVIGDDR